MYFIRYHLVPSSGIATGLIVFIYFAWSLVYDSWQGEAQFYSRAQPEINRLWREVQNPTLQTGPLKDLADDIRQRKVIGDEIKKQVDSSDRLRLSDKTPIGLDARNYPNLSVYQGRYVWNDPTYNPNVISEFFADDYKKYENGKLAEVFHQLQPYPNLNSFLVPWPAILYLWLLGTTIGYLFASEAYGHTVGDHDAKSLTYQAILAPVPGAVLALGGAGKGCGQLFVLCRRRLETSNRLKRHAFRKQIEELTAVLKALDKLPSTSEVGILHNQAQETLDALWQSPEAAQETLIKQLQNETKTANKLNELRQRVEKVNEVLMEERQTRSAIDRSIPEADEVGLKLER